jgi:hypothetical protein
VLLEHGRDQAVGNRPLGAVLSVRENKIGAAYEVHTGAVCAGAASEPSGPDAPV